MSQPDFPSLHVTHDADLARVRRNGVLIFGCGSFARDVHRPEFLFEYAIRLPGRSAQIVRTCALSWWGLLDNLMGRSPYCANN